MEWLSLVSLLGNTFLPPVYNIVKGIFSKGRPDTPEQTMSNLATTKPDILPQYVQALAQNRESEVKFFNKDVAGTPSQWVIDLRACIRPISVVLAFILIGISLFTTVNNALIISANGVIGNWLGTKIEVHV